MEMVRSARGLKYSVMGDGPQAVICHPSLGLGRFLFYRNIPPLSRRFTVVSYDPRGVGENGDSEPGLDAWVEDVGDIMTTLGRPCHLIGVSLGTWVMARAAGRWPDRVGRVILMGATPGFSQGEAAVQGRREDLAQRSMKDFARHYAETTLMAHCDPEIKDQLAQDLAVCDPEQYLKAMEAIYLADNHGAFAEVQAPTLVLVGAHDFRTTPAMADQVAELIPDARVRVVPDAGHLALLDQPQRIEELFEEFLTSGTLPD